MCFRNVQSYSQNLHSKQNESEVWLKMKFLNKTIILCLRTPIYIFVERILFLQSLNTPWNCGCGKLNNFL